MQVIGCFDYRGDKQFRYRKIKNLKRKIQMIRIVIFSLTFFVFAMQTYSQGHFVIHGGISIPKGKYATQSVVYPGASYAGTGVSLGGKYYQKTTNISGIYTALDGVINPYSPSAKEEIQEIMASSFSEFNFPEYINLMLTGGTFLYHTINDKINMFGRVGLALDMLKVTNYGFGAHDDNTHEITHKLSFMPGANIGADLIWNNKIEINLDYFYILEHTVEGRYIRGRLSDNPTIYPTVSFISVSLGYYLK
jgi:hypothetical protein